MVKLTKDEFNVLWQVEEGNNDLDAIFTFTNLSIELIKEHLKKLEKIGLIKLNIKINKHEENWIGITTKNAKNILEKYKDWIPNN